MRPLALALLLLTLPWATAASPQVSGKSPMCVEVVGKSAKDRDNALAFCAGKWMQPDIVSGAIAYESLLTLKVNRLVANMMMRDSITAEQIVKNWMRNWRDITARKSVTVTVETGAVEIAKGDTSFLGEDRVTVRRP